MYFDFVEISSKCNFDVNIINTLPLKIETLSIQSNNTLISNTTYNIHKFELQRNRLNKDKKSIIIICSKDNNSVLEYSLSKIKEYNIDKDHDILLVDDRSYDDSILKLSDLFQTSYIRIDNDHNSFNYSILTNIAACYAKHYNKELLIFYNNDMWPSSKDTLSNIIKKHYEYNSNITGCKLIYPTKMEYKNIGKPDHILQENINNAYNTIQHGGINFILVPPFFSYAPGHQWRFYDKNTEMASFDTRCFAVTGALQVINTETYLSLNGMDTRFATGYQDIDLCIRALEKQMIVTYVGTEYMYHAESITCHKEKVASSNNSISDRILWHHTWGKKLPHILGFQY